MSLHPPVAQSDHRQGGAHAGVELVEFGDYQCPYCGQAFPLVQDIRAALGEQLRLVFRNFPMSEIHPQAMAAAQAAEAAALQGRFWEMHALLYQNQQALDDAGLLQMAQSLGLDIARFEQDFNSAAVQDKIARDFESGVRSGVNGTPCFFINGKRFDGDWSGPALLQTLRALA